MPHFCAHPRYSTCTHHTGRWSTAPRYVRATAHTPTPSLAAIDLMRPFFLSFSISILLFFRLEKKKRVHAASAKHPILSEGDRRPECRWWAYDRRVRGMVGGVSPEQVGINI